MANEYWLIAMTPTTKVRLFTLAAKAELRFPHAFRSIHWCLSNDGLKAIIQADFPQVVIDELKTRSWATYLGNYVDGVADTAVIDYKDANPDDWSKAL